MNRDDIIRLAREAGFIRVVAIEKGGAVTTTVAPIEELEHFAALVAAAERDRMKAEGWRQCAEGQHTTQFCGLLEDAVKTEREQCALVCEDIPAPQEPTALTHIPTLERCAAAIRARKNELQDH
jgi:hypothetical protein